MIVYDTANKLAEEIKQTEEYKNFKRAKDEINNDPKKKELVDEFNSLKQELQLLEVQKLQNQNIDEEEKKMKLVKLYNVLVENQDIKQYFDYEIAFNKLIMDVNKIIGDAIKDLL